MKRVLKIISVITVLAVAVIVGGIAVLKSTDFNSYRGLIAEQVKSLTGRELAITGNLKLRISLNPALTVEGVSLANAAWGTRPSMASLKRLEAEVELLPLLSGKVNVKRIVLVGLDLRLETDFTGHGNWVFGNKASTAVRAEPKQNQDGSGIVPVVNMIRVEDATVTYLDRVSAHLFAVKIKSLDFTADGLNGPIKLDLTGGYNNLEFSASARLGSLNTLLGNAGPFPVSARLKMLGASFDIKGVVRDIRRAAGMDLKVVAELPDVAAFTRVFDFTTDKLPLLKLTAGITDVADGYVLDPLKLVMGNSDLAGRVAVSISGKKPRYDLDLTSDRIDLDQLLTKTDKPEKVRKTDDGRIFPKDILHVNGLRMADAKINFRGKRVDLGGISINDVSTRLELKNGRLDVSTLRAILSKGIINANILLDVAGKIPRVALNLDVGKLDYGALIEKYYAGNIISGNVDIRADVKGAGRSVRSIMASLGGRVRGVVKGGKVESGMLNILSADVLSALPFIDSKGDKDIRCAVVDFDIRSGLAKSRAIVFETGGLLMIGKGYANLSDETLNFKIDPSARKVSLIKLAMLPVNVGGTLASPSVTPDIGAAAVGVVTGAVSVGTGIVTGVAGVIGSAINGGQKSGKIDTTDYCKQAMAGKPLVRAGKSGATPSRKKPVPQPRKKEKNIIRNIGDGIGGALKSIIGQ